MRTIARITFTVIIWFFRQKIEILLFSEMRVSDKQFFTRPVFGNQTTIFFGLTMTVFCFLEIAFSWFLFLTFSWFIEIFWIPGLPRDYEYLVSPSAMGLAFLISLRFATIISWHFSLVRVLKCVFSFLVPGSKPCRKQADLQHFDQ